MILDNSSKLQKWLFEIGDVIDLLNVDSTLFQAVQNGVYWKCARILFPTEPLFLGGSDHLAVFEKARRGVVVKARDAENVQGYNPA